MDTSLKNLSSAIQGSMLRDRQRLRRQLDRLQQRLRQGKPVNQDLQKLDQQITVSVDQRQQRKTNLPVINFPESLPVSARRDEIAAAIDANQVVVIAGETGSGKTTQIPKICLQLGRGVDGMIGHTQPRRIAARSVAQRIAEEIGTPLGHDVGFKIRFSDQSSSSSYIKLMTDGILLSELQQDRWLNQYDTLIIDEAHERSLNIDFLFGVIKSLLVRRPDLKMIVTSATINTERFSKFFNDAPIIEVSGRTYPVEVRYRPPDSREGDADQNLAILEAVEELGRVDPLGDILIFFSGEREIHECRDSLRQAGLRDTEILPLFSRLSSAEQDRIFRSHRGRRIVLATNVAETSLTVPGIRFVIDTGKARISRYSHRTKVQQLPIEPISRASADQRKGRCGRVSDGICVRLYSEEDYLGRDQFPVPEIQRTNLASVILQMLSLRLGDIEEFDFIDPPDRRFIQDGVRILQEIGALDRQRKMTQTGRAISRFPIDPRLARMILAAANESALEEVLTIVAALEIQDPRERPLEKQQQADEWHRRFHEKGSDFITLLNLWNYLQELTEELSHSQQRKRYQKEFLSWNRIREWREVRSQLLRIARDADLQFNRNAASESQVHRALLTGLLGHIAHKDEEDVKKQGKPARKKDRPPRYLGARSIRLDIFPGSALVKAAPDWIMAAEMVESSRLFARTVARIDPEWLEPLAGDLCKRHYFEPHWSKRSARVIANEQVTLYGLMIVAKRRAHYGPVDTEESRRLFILHALVRGEYHTRAPFMDHNRRLLEELSLLEAKSRRRDLLVDEQLLCDFFDQRIPEEIYSGTTFERWHKKVAKGNSDLLNLRREDLISEDPLQRDDYPDSLQIGSNRFSLHYHFDPGHRTDGVTVLIPLLQLPGVSGDPFVWMVPGLIRDKIIALLRGLPKSLRRNFIPVTNFADALLERLSYRQGNLFEEIGQQLHRMTGIEVDIDQWKPEDLPDHLQMHFQIIDSHGALLHEGRDLQELQSLSGSSVRQTIRQKESGEESFEIEGLKEWNFGPLEEKLELSQNGIHYLAWIALVDEGITVARRLFENEQRAIQEHRSGILRLLILSLSRQLKNPHKTYPTLTKAQLHFAMLGKGSELLGQFNDALVGYLIAAEPIWEIRTSEDFNGLSQRIASKLYTQGETLALSITESLALHHRLQRQLKKPVAPDLLKQAGDIKRHLQQLIHPDFLEKTPGRWLLRLPLYLKAIEQRLEKMQRQPQQDRKIMAEFAVIEEALLKLQQRFSDAEEVKDLLWLFQELYISNFAQQLGTIEPISVVRINKRIQEVKKRLS